MNRGRLDRTNRAHPPVLDVVAGLVRGASAAPVARAAVREALARGARVRFVQVLAPHASEAERAADGARTFAAALKALREAKRVPVSFELAVGEAGPLLVDRSRNAELLIVGADVPGEPSGLARFCLDHAECEVHVAPSGVVPPVPTSGATEATEAAAPGTAPAASPPVAAPLDDVDRGGRRIVDRAGRQAADADRPHHAGV